MTDEEWEKVEKSLSRPYGHAKFMIDGYTVDIAVQPEKKLKYVLTVYVNKKCALYTCVNDCDIRSRFYYPSKHSCLSAADKQKLKKSFESQTGKHNTNGGIHRIFTILGKFFTNESTLYPQQSVYKTY